MKGTLLITGASGQIGLALIEHLIKKDYRVRILIHQNPISFPLVQLVTPYWGNILNPDSLHKAMKGVDVVFHLAGLTHTKHNNKIRLADYERINVQGTKHIVEIAKRERVTKIVYFSTISVYGRSVEDKLLNEYSIAQPSTAYAKTKYKAEEMVMNACSFTGNPMGVVLRLASVYGDRIKGSFAALRKAIQQGWFIPIGSGNNHRSMVHEKDVAQAAELAATKSNAIGQIYNVTDGQSYTMNQLLSLIYSSLNKSKPNYYLPDSLVHFILRRLAYLQAIRYHNRIERLQSQLSLWVENTGVNGQKIQEELGYQPQYHFEDTWKSIMKTYI
ncbi:MAG: NAD-dependent epimerase/dehydratase family protein [Desulfobacterales bacterium]|nr:NAD-dependent epimerase/dehydratase family protein [Desulfobacterales bacterium]